MWSRPVFRLIARGVDFAHQLVEILPVGERTCDGRQSNGTRRRCRIHFFRGNQRHHGRPAACNDNPLSSTNPINQLAEVSFGFRNIVACEFFCHMCTIVAIIDIMSSRQIQEQAA